MSKTHLQATAEEETHSNIGKIIAILLYASGSVVLLYLIILLVVLLYGGDTFCMGLLVKTVLEPAQYFFIIYGRKVPQWSFSDVNV